MDRSLQSCAALLLLGAAGPQTPPADSIVAAFDDSPPPAVAFIVDTPEPFLYKGLVWRGFSVIQSDHDSLAKFPRSGYARGAVSGTFAAVAAGRAFAQSTIEKYGGGVFVFYGMHLTAAWRTGLVATLEGLRGGEVVFVKQLPVNPTETVALSGAWEIDMLRIRASGGNNEGACPPGSCHPGPELVIDDFMFSPDAAGPAREMIASGGASLEPEIAPDVAVAEARASHPQAPDALEPQAEPEAERQTPAPPVTETALVAEEAKPPEPSAKGADPLPLPARMAGACDPAPYFGVQVGAFARERNARRLRSALEQTYTVVRIYRRLRGQGALHHLIVGCAAERSEAAALRRTLAAEGTNGFVVKIDEEFALSADTAGSRGAAEPPRARAVSEGESIEPLIAPAAIAEAKTASPQAPAVPEPQVEPEAERQPPVPPAVEATPVTEATPGTEARPAPPPAVEEAKPPEPSPEIAGPPLPARSGGACNLDPYFGVQVGAFARERNARRLQNALERTYGVVRIYRRQHEQGLLHHLIVGCSEERSEAAALRATLAAEETKGLVVKVGSEAFGEPL